MIPMGKKRRQELRKEIYDMSVNMHIKLGWEPLVLDINNDEQMEDVDSLIDKAFMEFASDEALDVLVKLENWAESVKGEGKLFK